MSIIYQVPSTWGQVQVVAFSGLSPSQVGESVCRHTHSSVGALLVAQFRGISSEQVQLVSLSWLLKAHDTASTPEHMHSPLMLEPLGHRGLAWTTHVQFSLFSLQPKWQVGLNVTWHMHWLSFFTMTLLTGQDDSNHFMHLHSVLLNVPLSSPHVAWGGGGRGEGGGGRGEGWKNK